MIKVEFGLRSIYVFRGRVLSFYVLKYFHKSSKQSFLRCHVLMLMVWSCMKKKKRNTLERTSAMLEWKWPQLLVVFYGDMTPFWHGFLLVVTGLQGRLWGWEAGLAASQLPTVYGRQPHYAFFTMMDSHHEPKCVYPPPSSCFLQAFTSREEKSNLHSKWSFSFNRVISAVTV